LSYERSGTGQCSEAVLWAIRQPGLPSGTSKSPLSGRKGPATGSVGVDA